MRYCVLLIEKSKRSRPPTTLVGFIRFLLLAASVVPCGALMTRAAVQPAGARIDLDLDWFLQSSRKIYNGGDVISSRHFKPEGWIPASLPSTVVAAQVAAGTLPDPYVGTNLQRFPGMTYKAGDNFALHAMDANSPYSCSWWYRTDFVVPRDYAKRHLILHFHGINYRANVWLNGKKIADSADVAGAYRRYELDVTAAAEPSARNRLAIEVFPSTEKDLAINWVDWSPAPPDKNMGIWGDVYLTASGPVTVRYPQVTTNFPGEPSQQANLTVRVELRNTSTHAVRGVLEAELLGTVLRQAITLQSGEARFATFNPEAYPSLKVKDPELWWPVNMGAQILQELVVRFRVGGEVSEEQHARFGIREITTELTDKGYRLFRVNRKKVLIRGGGWALDMLLRRSSERTEARLQYVRAMNLNAIRLEGQLDTDDSFFDRADQLGILVMAGWCCCDIWEEWDQWQPQTQSIAIESLRSQMLRLRNHPSLFVWLNGSDNPPPENVERAYLKVAKETGWPNPILSSASATPTPVTGPTGVKMTGPYDYVPPSYWLTDTQHGGAYGFNTETSPGPAIPVEESLRKMIPKDHLWPIGEVWTYHAGGGRFQDIHIFNEALNKTYGMPTSLDDFVRKSQAMAYDGERAMFEAYARNKYTSTGIIQWMTTNAWPSLIWHLYDYYLQPGGGYFGTKKACEPLHVQYSYDDRGVVLVNNDPRAHANLTVTARALDFELNEIFAKELTADIAEDSVKTLFAIPPFPKSESGVYFVKLSARDSGGKELSSNFYWLPATPSTLDWNKTNGTAYTPIAAFEDLTPLNHLARAGLRGLARIQVQEHVPTVTVELHNPSNSLAFQVRLAIEEDGREVLPVLWDDNYVTLLPGESRSVRASYPSSATPGGSAVVRVEGWNFDGLTIPVSEE